MHIVSAGAGSWIGAGAFAVITALAFMINRQRPLAFWAYLVLLGFVEFTICGLGLAIDGRQVVAFHLALLFMFDALIMLAAGRVAAVPAASVRGSGAVDRPGGLVASRWISTLLAAIPVSTIVLTLVADGVGLLDLDRTWLAGSCSCWDRRRGYGRRGSYGIRPWFTSVWPSSWGARFDLASCAAGWNNAHLAGRMARGHRGMPGPGALGGRNRDAATQAFGVLYRALLPHGLLPDDRGLRRGASGSGAGPRSLSACRGSARVNVLVTMLLARTWRRAELTYFAVFHFVTATYLVLFSVGNNDPNMAYVLGLAAVGQAIALWGIGFVCERVRDAWTSECCPAALSLGRSFDRRRGFAQRSVIPRARLGGPIVPLDGQEPSQRKTGFTARSPLCSAACYFRWLGELPRLELIACATLAAFVLWGLGVLIQRYKPAVCQRLGLRPLAYEYPLFNSSIAVALTALALRVESERRASDRVDGHGLVPDGARGFEPGHAAGPTRPGVRAHEPGISDLERRRRVAPSLTSACFVGLAGSIARGRLSADRAIPPAPRAGALCSAGRDRCGIRPGGARLGSGRVWPDREPGDRCRGRGNERGDPGSSVRSRWR